MNDSKPGSRLIPEEYAAKLRHARARGGMQGERRLVTILFCDVTGSTAMAEQLDPEDWAEIMDDAFDLLIAPIYRYEGTIGRLMGDAILAFFGAPIAHEDDPQRAILAGLEILQSIQPFAERIRGDHGLEFNVRVGINSGHVVVGEIGSDLAVEYTAMGDAVNLAARMEQTAQPGTVQIAEATYRLVAPLIEVQALGGIQVKGKNKAVQAYRVVGWKEEPGRLRGIEGLSSPVIGREREMDQLHQAVEAVRQGRGGYVTLIGEAGLGKSRLLDELRSDFRLHAPQADFTTVEFNGLSYDAHSPYGIFRRSLREEYGVTMEDSPQSAWQKITTSDGFTPTQIEEGVGKSLAAMGQLIDLEGEAQGPPLEGENFKRQLFENYPPIWSHLASLRPLIIIVDDLHWVDAASVELLDHLARLVDSDPILYIFAMRPFRQSPGWQIKLSGETRYPHRYTEISLSPLSSQDSSTLVSNLLTISDLPTDVHQAILTKAEGNPFFVEELIRSLIEAGVLVRDESEGLWRASRRLDAIALPENLQALLVSRIDRLDKAVRRTLQLASVIGRTFYQRVLARVADTAETVDAHLNTLQRVDLIQETLRIPELQFRFVHELTRDAAYYTILRRQRREDHRQVGEAIETLFPERSREEAHRLAWHFKEAGDPDRALKYYTMAGDLASRYYAITEAVEHYRQALALARHDGSEVKISEVQWIHLHSRLGRALEINNSYDEALEVYEALQSLAEEHHSPTLELAALVPQAVMLNIPSGMLDPARSQQLTDRALTLARELGDPKAEARMLWNQMRLREELDRDFTKGVEYGEQAIAIARQHNLEEELAYALHDITGFLTNTGQRDRAMMTQEEARQLFTKLGLKEMLADNLNQSSVGRYYLGLYDEAIELAREGLQVSESIGSTWGQAYSYALLTMLYLAQGKISAGLASFDQTLHFAAQADLAPLRITLPGSVALNLARLGALERALDLTRLSQANAAEYRQYSIYPQAILAVMDVYSGNPASAHEKLEGLLDKFEFDITSPEILSTTISVTSEIYLPNGKYEQVLETIDTHLPSIEVIQLQMAFPEILYYRGLALHRLGRVEEARQSLAQAQALAEEMGDRMNLWRVLGERWQLEEQAGQPDQAEIARRQAQEVIDFILEHMEEPDLRTAYRNVPIISRILSD